MNDAKLYNITLMWNARCMEMKMRFKME